MRLTPGLVHHQNVPLQLVIHIAFEVELQHSNGRGASTEAPKLEGMPDKYMAL